MVDINCVDDVIVVDVEVDEVVEDVDDDDDDDDEVVVDEVIR